MLTTLAMGFAAVVCTRFGGNVFNRKLMAVTGLAVVLMLVASTFIFTSRLGLSDMSLSSSVVLSVYADNLQPNETAWRGLVAGSPIESAFYSTMLSNGMYYISGAFEFSNLWTRPDPQPFAYGGYNGIAYVRAIQIVLAPGDRILVRRGQSGLQGRRLPDLLWRHMGGFRLFRADRHVPHGLCLQADGRAGACRGSIAALPIYLYLVIVIFFMPVSNFINGGLGNYIIATFLMVAAVFRDLHLRAQRLAPGYRSRPVSP